MSGGLGDGAGKWQLFVSADGDVEVVSLMSTPTGHLTNLSVSGLHDTGMSEPESPPAVGSTFRDCAACPEMVVVPAGSYLMGSLADDPFRGPDEGPAHRVTIGAPFAVGVHEVTFAQWDACHRAGGCSHRADDQGWGRGTRPVVDVSWDDAQEYVRWLSGETGRAYRLPSEAEWEYAARAGTTGLFWWGDAVGQGRANCDRCGSRWDGRQTAPVGSFAANAFGLHDVHGNVWERVQDCRNDDYVGAPSDGSAWESGNCNARGVRGGGWKSIPLVMRAANRAWVWPPSSRVFDAETGFRVARTLAEPARHTLALFRPAGQTQQGFARIINRSNRAGTVRITGTDDTGDRRGPIGLRLEAGATRHFNSDDVEGGNAAKGLSGSLGDGEGDWRLELVSDLDIEPSAYIRTPDGFLTAMHTVVRSAEVGGETVHQVPIFNPGSNRNQVSWLRVANLTGAGVNVTIRGRDDEGRAARSGEVRLTLPAHGARRISAQQLESGAAGLSGRLGAGMGKWQLFVTADGAIEVVSLLQSPTGHLSNLSTTPGGAVETPGFEVVAEGPATVRPLQTMSLMVPDGLGESDYTVLMDLSGTGEFAALDIIEVEGLTTDDDRILFAFPLTRMLFEANSSHRLAVRVRREMDQGLSRTLQFAIDDIAVDADLPGFSTTLLEVLLTTIYASTDDPLLKLDAESIRPGSWMYSARRLGLDTTFADAQAEAALQSLFGMPMTEIAPGAPAPASAVVSRSGHVGLASARALDTRAGEGQTSLACTAADLTTGQGALCDAAGESLACMRRYDEIYDAATGRGGVDDFNEMTLCIGNAFRNFNLRDAIRSSVENAVGGALGAMLKKGVTVLARSVSSRADEAIEVASDAHAFYNSQVGILKLAESENRVGGADDSDSSRHYERNASGGLDPTPRGRSSSVDSLKAVSKSVSQLSADRIIAAEGYLADRQLDDGEREAVSSVVNESDRLQDDAAAIERFEDVYKGETKPFDAIKNDPLLGRAVASSCEAGYVEFVVDEETSTCVFESLVEDNCHAGSRRPSDVNLGESQACLYYSLDILRSDGSCRQNYERVFFKGTMDVPVGRTVPGSASLVHGEERARPRGTPREQESDHQGYQYPIQRLCGWA